ncbi:MAG: hypothetical protein K0B87_04605 [Candidatus Syntrophosphaera sp.]|nr:hypothetical protein [Candidatus Syntrophosphaera sp.]
MKVYLRFFLLVALGLTLFVAMSCSSDDKPTTPNFENVSPYLWDYDHVLWFDLDYDYADKLGNTRAWIWFTVKGIDTEATLTINNVDVPMAYCDSYTKGRIYFADTYVELNTNQPVSYKITKNPGANEKLYRGTIEVGQLPDEVDGPTAQFIETNNYAPNWTIIGDIDPNFQLIEAAIHGDEQIKYYTRQVPGSERNHLLYSTFWQELLPVEEFSFYVNAITYKMRNSNKVLTVGVSYDGYEWWNFGKDNGQSRKLNVARVMETINQDLQK